MAACKDRYHRRSGVTSQEDFTSQFSVRCRIGRQRLAQATIGNQLLYFLITDFRLLQASTNAVERSQRMTDWHRTTVAIFDPGPDRYGQRCCLMQMEYG